MKHRMILAVLAVVAAVSIGAGVAVAADDDKPKRSTFVEAVAAKLGVSPEKLQEAIKAVATERAAERTAKINAKIDEAVEAGKLTPEQAAKKKELLQRMTERLQNAKGFGLGKLGKKGFGKFGKRGKAGVAKIGTRSALADALGIDPEKIREGLKSGKTFAQIAQENGKTAADVKAALEKTVDDKIAKITEKKKLTDEQVAKYREKLDQWIDKVVDKLFAAPAKTS